MRFPHRLLVVLLAASACSSNPPTLPVVQPGATVSTRSELEQQLADLEVALAFPETSRAERDRLQVEAEAIRQRLEYGDFRVGDRILLSVLGEPSLPDTLIVAPGLVVEMALFGEASVAGVLRSEITDHLSTALGAYIRDPVVRANGLMRVTVLGAVGNPGFFTMPAETVLGDAIMVAGGPAQNANLDRVEIRRGTVEIMDSDAVQGALQQGLTLDQLHLQAGDQVFIPPRTNFWRDLRWIVGLGSSLGFLVWRLVN